MKVKFGLRKKFSLLLGIITIVIILASIIGLITGKNLEKKWIEYDAVAIKRMEILSSLRADLGYGGLIHDFKNYVLRGQKENLQSFEEKVFIFEKHIKEYQNLQFITIEEKKNINVIKETVEKYKENMYLIKEHKLNEKTIEEIDNMVKVDDSMAQNAIESLDKKREYFTQIETLSFHNIVNKANLVIISFIIIQFFSIIAILILITKITSPLKFFTSELEKGSSGDLTIMLDIKSNDEIGVLASYFNKFISKLHKIILDVKSYSEYLAMTSDLLQKSTKKLEESAKHLQNSTNSSSAAIEEMAGTVSNIAKNAQNVAKNAGDSQEIAEKGGEAVSEVINEMGRIKNVVDQGALGVRELGNKIDEISDIVTVINDIASQTNLLALNAAIEAARAGDAGRGFEVVAEEVRKLAEKTTDATKEIANMIKQIQTETERVIIKMGQATEEVDAGVKLVDSTGDILEKIVSIVSDGRMMIDMIAMSAKEQSIATEEIATQAENITNNAEETAFILKKSFENVEENFEISKKLENIVKMFKVDTSKEIHIKALRERKKEKKNYIIWGPDVMVGVDLIDSEHQTAIEAMNDLLNAIEDGEGAAKLDETMDFVSDYIKEHFRDEEELMIKHKYPDYDKQKKAHEYFENVVEILNNDIKAKGVFPGAAIRVKKDIADWFVNHILRMDTKIGIYLHKKNIR